MWPAKDFWKTNVAHEPKSLSTTDLKSMKYFELAKEKKKVSLCSLSIRFQVSRVVCGGRLCLICAVGHAAVSQWMLHWWQSNDSTTRETFPCTHPFSGTRQGRSRAPFAESSVCPGRDSNLAYLHLRRVL